MKTLLRGATLVLLALSISACEPSAPYDLIISGGRVIDPATGRDEITAVAVVDDRIVEIGDFEPGSATLEIDATGLVVSPGFVDTLTFKPTNQTIEKYKALDGVTTVVFGHDGSIDVPFYFDYQSRWPHRINYATSVRGYKPHNLVREWRLKQIETGIQAGGVAIAATPEYNFETPEEMLDLATLAAKYDVPLVLHLRGSARENELDGVDEAIDLARRTGVHVHAMHIHSTGATYGYKEAIEKIRAARAEGLRVTADVYPYTYWMTDFRSDRFNNFQEKYGLDYEDLQIAGTAEKLTKARFEELRNQMIYVAVPEGTIPDEALDIALREPYIFIASDGQIEQEQGANAHPRSAGAFAEAFEEASKRGIDLPTIISKVTSEPLRLFQTSGADFNERGSIAPGKIADITIFDPDRIAHRGTIENPTIPSEGIEWVIVNGTPVVAEGELTEAVPGRVLKRKVTP